MRRLRGNRGSQRRRKTSRSGYRWSVWDRLMVVLTWHRDAPPWKRRAAMGFAAIAVVLTLIGTVNWMIRADVPGRIAQSIRQATVALTVDLGFSVRDVYVVDRTETAQADLLRALGTKIGDPILFFDAVAARRRLLQLGWVEDALVERRLPGRIMVMLRERRPIAIWQHRGQFLLVDRGGHVIGPKEKGRFENLKIVIGDDAPRHAVELLAMLERDPEMMQRVTHATWVSGRQWNIRIENAIDVKLPADNAEAAWLKLLDMERDYRVLNRDISIVDLRVPNKTSVRVNGRPQPAADRDNQT